MTRMIQLKLKEGCAQVFVRLSLENPSTGARNIVDAKIDTGAIVTIIPMDCVSGMGFEIVGESVFTAANGEPLHTYVTNAILSLSDEDELETPIYLVKNNSSLPLIGMDFLSQCNFAQWHESENGAHTLHFEIETFKEETS